MLPNLFTTIYNLFTIYLQSFTTTLEAIHSHSQRF
jgi:hypothetical protein